MLSRIAQLDQRTALPDQCLHSAEADVRPPRRKSGFDAVDGSSTGTRVPPLWEQTQMYGPAVRCKWISPSWR